MADAMTIEPLEALADSGAMPDSELAALLQSHETKAVGYYNSDIADEQAKAIDHYYGRPFGDERAGRSQVVDRTVAITIDNALAALLKPFVSAEDVVSFSARGPADMELAEQATEFVNYVFQNDNDGFLILHDWMKDALLSKLGVVKYWWEDQSRSEIRHERVDAIGLLQARDSATYLSEADNGDGSFTVAHEMRVPDGRVRIRNVPPEEFLISPLARSIEEAPYVAHRPANMTRSDLIDMGMDAALVETLPAHAEGRGEEARSQARYADEAWSSGAREAVGNDRSRDVIGVLDEYVRVDFDGDGVAELRRIVRVGDTILLNEAVEDRPFATLCPVPMPHKVYGLSLADQVMDLQRIASVLWRQMLDNLYLTNNPRPIVPDSAVNDRTMDSLFDDAPGAEISVKAPGQLDFQAVPFVAQHSFPMLEYIEQQMEARSGVGKTGQGIDTNALRKAGQMTATEIMTIESGKNARVEMIARIFAETGITRLFKGLAGLLGKYQPKARMIRLRNRWVEVDPRGWPEMDVRISVGLGIGNKADQVAQADSVLATMAELQRTPYAYLVDARKLHAALKRKLNAAGIKNVDDYLVDPAGVQPPTPGPNADQAKAQADAQATAMALKLKQEEGALRLQLAREESAAKLALEREKASAEIQLARDKMAAEIALERERMELAMTRDALKAERARDTVDEPVTIAEDRPGGSLAE